MAETRDEGAARACADGARRYAEGTRTKVPFVSKSQLERIVASHPTPLHLYDEHEIRARARALAAAFSWNEGFKEYFAVKATPNPRILQVLAEEGCGADCATDTELVLARAVGLSGTDVMLSSNDTPDETYRLAHELGAIINLDSADMVDCLVRSLGGAARLPRLVCLRLNPGGSFEADNQIIGSPEESKFGMTLEQLLDAARRLRDLGVRELGLHAFLASNTQGEAYYPKLAEVLFACAVRVRDEVGLPVRLIDLSGGVGVAYEPEVVPPDIAAIGRGVRAAFERVLVPAGMGDVRVACELGRWMLGPAGVLVTRVLHEKVTYRDYLGVDACAANLMRPAMYDAYHHITVMGHEGGPDKSRATAERRYNVVGGLCENNDQFARGRVLPPVEVGDLLVIHDTGAHGHSMGYNYNGRLRSAEVLLREDGSCELIRRAETMGDHLSTAMVGEMAARLEDALGRCGFGPP